MRSLYSVFCALRCRYQNEAESESGIAFFLALPSDVSIFDVEFDFCNGSSFLITFKISNIVFLVVIGIWFTNLSGVFYLSLLLYLFYGILAIG